MKKEAKKKGLSPVVSSTLLVLVVIIAAAILFMWARGFVREAVKKNQLSAEQACGELKFSASAYWDGTDIVIDVANKANVAINQFFVKKVAPGKTDSEEAVLNAGSGLNGGESTTFKVSGTYTTPSGPANYPQVVIIPQILGSTQKGKSIYTCDERFGIIQDVA